jgi:DNA-binding transcriptional LysR family regulator
MNIEELRSFSILAGHLHFGRASAALHLTQPALTKQMRRLEKALGGQLLERGKHGTALTGFGERFLPRARELVGSYDGLLASARKEAQGRGGRVRIGFGYYTYELVPRLVVKLRSLEPDIEVTLRDMSTIEQLRDLRNGELDLGFLRLPLPEEGEELQSHTVLRGQLALAMPLDRGEDGPVRLARCREKPFVLLSKQRSPGLYERVLKLCAGHGFFPRIIQEVTEITTALALVRAGMGYSIIPESSWSRLFGGVNIQALKEKAATWTVGAVWRRRDSNAALGRILGLVRV